jgi:hypothetical protein
MSATQKPVRRSVSIPPAVAKRVRSMAKKQRASEGRVLVDLIEAGLAAKDEERQRFRNLVDRLARATSKAEQSRLKEELARLTFGD